MHPRRVRLGRFCLALALTLALIGCSTSSSDEAPASSTSVTTTPTVESSPAPLVRGDLFTTSAPPSYTARYSRTVDARGKETLRIAIVGIDALPAFSPSVVEVDPGQVLTVTVFQSGGASAQFHHNFSIESLGIDRTIPSGEYSVTVTVTIPVSGTLTFFCSFHADLEQHAGEFRVA